LVHFFSFVSVVVNCRELFSQHVECSFVADCCFGFYVQLMQQNLPANIATTPLALPPAIPAANAVTADRGLTLFILFS